MNQNELYHHGVKGMKWGIRRYQNKDGTLTNRGKSRYERDAKSKDYDRYDADTGKYYKKTKKGRKTIDADASRYFKEDLERSKRLADSGRNLSGDMKRAIDTSTRNRNVPKMDLSNMSDQEMRNRINRSILEKQYNNMFNPRNESKGRKYASRVFEKTGNALAITSSAFGIALAIKELRGK